MDNLQAIRQRLSKEVGEATSPILQAIRQRISAINPFGEETFTITSPSRVTPDELQRAQAMQGTHTPIGPTRVPSPSPTVTASPSPTIARSRALPQPGRDVQSTIAQAASEFGVDPDLMMRIAFAESSYNPKAKSNESTAEGLFQFIDSSWKQMMKELGLPENTPKTDPEANARAAAAAIAKGRLGWWDASRNKWGQ